MMRMEGRAPSPVEELLTAPLRVTPQHQSPAPGGKSAWEEGASYPGVADGKMLGLSYPRVELHLALTKLCLVSCQLQARLTITVGVYDGQNDPVSAGTRAGWLQRVWGWEGKKGHRRAMDEAWWGRGVEVGLPRGG